MPLSCFVYEHSRGGRILDDKFVASFGGEKPLDKEAFIKLVVSGDADPGAFDHPDWIFELKHDGLRALALREV